MSSEINYSAKNLTIINRFNKNPDRHYVEEFFNILPGLEETPVFTQSTSILNDVSTDGGEKYGIVRTSDTELNLNIAREFTFKNSIINSNSLISTSIQSVTGNINDSETMFGNSALSVFSHSKNVGSCKIRLINQGDNTKAFDLPLQKYDIHFNINPHIPVNPNWSLTGTNVKSNCVIPAEEEFGRGVILLVDKSSSESIIQLRNKSTLGFTKTHISSNENKLLSDANLSQINVSVDPTSLFFTGDPVYNSDGILLGILKTVTASQFVFIDDIKLQITNGDFFYLRNTNNSIASSKYLNTKSQFEFECSIKTGTTLGSVTDASWYLGLKETSSGIVTTDNNQAYFFYDKTRDQILRPSIEFDAFSSGKLFFAYSVSGVDYVTRLPVSIEASTVYKFRIIIDENRQLSIFIDSYTTGNYSNAKASTQYNLNNTGTNIAGSDVTTGTTKSNTISDVDLFPFIGVNTNSSAGNKYITVNYIKMSRFLN